MTERHEIPDAQVQQPDRIKHVCPPNLKNMVPPLPNFMFYTEDLAEDGREMSVHPPRSVALSHVCGLGQALAGDWGLEP